MSTSLAALIVPDGDMVDLGDAFAWLYDMLVDDAPTAFEVSRSLAQETTEVVKAGKRCIELGELPRAALRSVIDDRRKQLALLRSLDVALGSIDEYSGAPQLTPMAEYRARLESNQRLNDQTAGWVLPRRVGPGRPRSSKFQDWSDCLTSVVRVREPSAGLRYSRIDPEWDFPVEVRSLSETGVAAVAFIGSVDELQVQRLNDREGQCWYSIQPKSSKDWSAHQRVQEALEAMDRSGAYLGVLPELMLNDEMVNIWRSTLASTPRPADSRLHWIMAGTGPVTGIGGQPEGAEQPPNRAVMLDRATGHPVRMPGGGPYLQDKRRGFTLAPEHIEKWGLTDLRPRRDEPSVDLAEWMREGRERLIVDTRLGRIAILICEDVGRLLTEGSELVPIGPSHILVPIFAEPIRKYFWETKAGQQLASEIGSSTLVINSSAVQVAGVKDQCGALLVQVQYEADDSSWPVTVEFAPPRLDSPAEVHRFSMRRA